MITVYCAGSDIKHSMGFKMNRPNGCGHYEIVFVKTRTRFYLSTGTFDVRPYTVVVYDKSEGQMYKSLENEHIDDYLHFDMDEKSYNELKDKLQMQIPIKIQQIDALSRLFWLIAYEHSVSSEYKAEHMSSLVYILINTIFEDFNNKNSIWENDEIDSVSSLHSEILMHPEKAWNIEKSALYCHMSKSKFQKVYKKVYNQTFLRDLISIRMDLAKNLLINSNRPLQDIAVTCGFCNFEHFSRQFKQYFSVSPLKYRMLNSDQ